MSMQHLVLASTLLLLLAHDNVIAKGVLGGFFDEDESMRGAFELAVRTINACKYDHEICELMHSSEGEDDINLRLFHRAEFLAVAENVDGSDLPAIYKKFDEMAGTNESATKQGLSTVIGPHDRVSSFYMQGLCDHHDIPHIVVRRESESWLNHGQMINIYPDTETMATVYIQMIKKLKWESFSILYQRTENLLALQSVLKIYKPFTFDIYSFRLGRGPNFSEPLLLAKSSGHSSFLVDCDYDVLFDVLRQSQEIGLMSETNRFIVASLDLQTIDLWPFQHTGANISGLRIVDTDNPFVSEFVGSHLEDFEINSVNELLTEDALMFDAVALFAQGYKDFVYKNPVRVGGAKLPRPPWAHGLSLRNYIISSELDGLTGPVMLDGDGVRRRFQLDFMNLEPTGLAKIGTWDPELGFDDLKLRTEIATLHYKVLITMNPPYAQKVSNSLSLAGNDRYEGFTVDIIKALARELKFNYTFYVQEDSDNGNCTKNKATDQCTCSGMMGKLLSNEMDLAITDLTVTENRAQCIQFSTTFMNLGISILYKKAQKAVAKWYSFFMPFNYRVWIYLFLVWVLTSVMFYILSRISPLEWDNPYPCIDEPTELINQYTIDNSFWFTIGSMVQQGSELAPIGSATRCLAGFWWFFCLIITNTYTANLAAFLTAETPVKSVNGIQDLYNQTKIVYGAKKGGSTVTFFKGSSDPRHQQLYQNMIDPEWEYEYMPDTNDHGIELVQDKEIDYAFFMESSSIEYVQHRKCDLEQAGGLIDQKAYAIGYAKDFKYSHEVNKVISTLNENSYIKELYRKWWTEKGAVCGDKPENAAKAMTLDKLVGVFYVLGGGLLVSFIVTSIEFYRAARTTARVEQVSVKEVIMTELKNIAGGKSVKPIIAKRKSSESRSCDLTLTTQT